MSSNRGVAIFCITVGQIWLMKKDKKQETSCLDYSFFMSLGTKYSWFQGVMLTRHLPQ